jgi:hypothetical protein
MANPLPTAIRMRAGVESGGDNARIGVFGSDFHDIGDDAIFLADARAVRLEGLRIWNVDEKSFDPGQVYGNDQDWFHNDGIQTVGAISDVQIADSWIGQKIQWGAEGGDIEDVDVRRLWFAGSSTFGQINAVENGGKILDNTQDDVRVFANGQKNGVAHDKLRTDFVDGVQRAIWPRQYLQAGVFEIPATNVTTAVPAGITLSNGKLTNINEVRDHPENPANKWRRAHRYATWGSFLKAR